jgi:hypothetical protein
MPCHLTSGQLIIHGSRLAAQKKLHLHVVVFTDRVPSAAASAVFPCLGGYTSCEVEACQG